ncbi:hypothetical protein GS885_02365 [Rhodococcus hoagii]|nr:hypothetical protein [Prescottella equi]NKS02667.1 hypothetical protein [Prescottella equi]NKT40014.1 hypothetical protein [Prescottella equi]NKT56877.1 hypothetical protein [Prescottella equi]NKT61607.1 hypothetical protein [Prescottella equi]
MTDRLVMKVTPGLYRPTWGVRYEQFQKRENWGGLRYMRPMRVVLFGPERMIAEGRREIAKLKGGVAL